MVFCEHPTGTPILLIGSGLIGSAIGRMLRQRTGYTLQNVPQDWASPDPLHAALERAFHWISMQRESPQVLHVIWSAGRAGFSADQQTCDQELSAFQQVTAWCRRLPNATNTCPGRFILISSAGGLFEGQRCVAADTPATPRRPYGHMKVMQERHALDALPAAGWDLGIYRPSSVYGPAYPNQRQGLISTLVANSLCGAETMIRGTMRTVRDFVWVNDIAAYINDELTIPVRPSGSNPVLLAAFRPSTLFEVCRRIEQILQHRLRVRYEPRQDNAADMSFSPSIAPARWQASTLEETVPQLYRFALQFGTRWGYADRTRDRAATARTGGGR
jgi:nucleoside-diphosphate-sugar epimerase